MTEEVAPYGSGPTTSPDVRKVRIHHLQHWKAESNRWAMLTAYDQYAAQVFDEAGIPVLLVGDSASNNVYGNETSLPVTVDELIPLVRAVTRSAHRALVVGGENAPVLAHHHVLGPVDADRDLGERARRHGRQRHAVPPPS